LRKVARRLECSQTQGEPRVIDTAVTDRYP